MEISWSGHISEVGYSQVSAGKIKMANRDGMLWRCQKSLLNFYLTLIRKNVTIFKVKTDKNF